MYTNEYKYINIYFFSLKHATKQPITINMIYKSMEQNRITTKMYTEMMQRYFSQSVVSINGIQI